MHHPSEDELAIVPVFPLPNAVLFPETVLPLNIFEPRYRAMVEHVMNGDGLIAVALLKPGFEEFYEGSPDIHTLATVGRIEDLRPQDDGSFLLNLVGLMRVRLDEIPSDHPFRIARATPVPESFSELDDPSLERGKVELLASLGYLLQEISDESDAAFVLDERQPLQVAVNSSCANLPVQPVLRQELLEIDDLLDRKERVTEVVNTLLRKVLSNKAEKPGQTDLRVN